MKLIMENWRGYVHEQGAPEHITEGEKIADDLIVSYEKEPLNEEFVTATVLAAKFILPLFLKLLGGAALSAATAKLGNWIHKKFHGAESDFLGRAGEVFEQATRVMATLGITKGANKAVQWYFNRKCTQLDPNNPEKISCSKKIRLDKRKWLARIQVTETIITVAVLLSASINELVSAAKEAGGLGQAVMTFFQEAGLKNEQAQSALVDAIGTSLDVGEAAAGAKASGEKAAAMGGAGFAAEFNKQKFWADIRRSLRVLWSGER